MEEQNCEKCGNKLDENNTCFNCIEEEAYQTKMKSAFKHEMLIESLKELGWEAHYEYDGDYGEYEYEYITLDHHRSQDELCSTDIIKLYEMIISKVKDKLHMIQEMKMDYEDLMMELNK